MGALFGVSVVVDTDFKRDRVIWGVWVEINDWCDREEHGEILRKPMFTINIDPPTRNANIKVPLATKVFHIFFLVWQIRYSL